MLTRVIRYIYHFVDSSLDKSIFLLWMSYITKMTIVLYSTQFLHIGKKTISAMLSLATTFQQPTTQLTPMHIKMHYTPSTTHPTVFHNPPLHTTNKHKVYLCKRRQNGTRCRDSVKVLWYHSDLVWFVSKGRIPTWACFHSENFFVTCSLFLASFPGPAQLSVTTASDGKLGGAWERG